MAAGSLDIDTHARSGERIAMGTMHVDVSIAITGDSRPEYAEYFKVRIDKNKRYLSIAEPEAVGLIEEDISDRATLVLRPPSEIIEEGDSDAPSFTVSIEDSRANAERPLCFSATTMQNPSTDSMVYKASGADYTSLNQAEHILDRGNALNVPIAIADDLFYEHDEVFDMRIEPSNCNDEDHTWVTIETAAAQATAIIRDNFADIPVLEFKPNLPANPPSREPEGTQQDASFDVLIGFANGSGFRNYKGALTLRYRLYIGSDSEIPREDAAERDDFRHGRNNTNTACEGESSLNFPSNTPYSQGTLMLDAHDPASQANPGDYNISLPICNDTIVERDDRFRVALRRDANTAPLDTDSVYIIDDMSLNTSTSLGRLLSAQPLEIMQYQTLEDADTVTLGLMLDTSSNVNTSSTQNLSACHPTGRAQEDSAFICANIGFMPPVLASQIEIDVPYRVHFEACETEGSTCLHPATPGASGTPGSDFTASISTGVSMVLQSSNGILSETIGTRLVNDNTSETSEFFRLRLELAANTESNFDRVNIDVDASSQILTIDDDDSTHAYLKLPSGTQGRILAIDEDASSPQFEACVVLPQGNSSFSESLEFQYSVEAYTMETRPANLSPDYDLAVVGDNTDTARDVTQSTMRDLSITMGGDGVSSSTTRSGRTELCRNFLLDIRNDAIVEAGEIFRLSLVPKASATLPVAIHPTEDELTVLIVNDDSVNLSLQVSSMSLDEDDPAASSGNTFTFTVSKPSSSVHVAALPFRYTLQAVSMHNGSVDPVELSGANRDIEICTDIRMSSCIQAPASYEGISGSIPADMDSTNIYVRAMPDAIVEATEHFSFALVAPASSHANASTVASIVDSMSMPATQVLSITDNDTAELELSLSPSGASTPGIFAALTEGASLGLLVSTGDSHEIPIVFSYRLAAPSLSPMAELTDITVSGVSSLAFGAEYSSNIGAIEGIGGSQATISLAAVEDSVVEASESLTFELALPAGSPHTIATASGGPKTIRIRDNDRLRFSFANAGQAFVLDEPASGQAPATLAIAVSGSIEGASASITCVPMTASNNDTAAAGTDYASGPVTVSVNDAPVDGTIVDTAMLSSAPVCNIPILADNQTDFCNETFTANLSVPDMSSSVSELATSGTSRAITISPNSGDRLNCPDGFGADGLSAFCGGTGTHASPYTIVHVQQLHLIHQDICGNNNDETCLDKHFRLMGDIDASETQSWHIDSAGTLSSGLCASNTMSCDSAQTNANHADYCRGFHPIGTSGNPFTGSIRGETMPNGSEKYKIRNLYIQRPSAPSAGLIAYYAGANGNEPIRNIKLENPRITGGRASSAFVGSITGEMSAGKLEGIEVMPPTESAYIRSGGEASVSALVGRLTGGEITDCTTAMPLASAVQNASNYGGLIGVMTGGTLQDSYSSSAVTSTGENASNYGGLIGSMTGGTLQNTSTQTTSLATGNISSTGSNASNYGGLIGSMTGGTLQNTSTQTTPLTTGDVSSTGNNTNSYGGLIGSMAGGTVSGSGAWSATGNVSSTGSDAHHYGGLIGMITGGTVSGSGAWSATGNVGSRGSQAHRYGGLIGSMTGGTVSGSGAWSATGNVSSRGINSDYYGGLIGELRSTSGLQLKKISAEEGSVSSAEMDSDYYGGLIGYVDGVELYASYATKQVGSLEAGSDYYGGLIGDANNVFIYASHATGRIYSVESESSYYGGLIGRLNSSGGARSRLYHSFATGELVAGCRFAENYVIDGAVPHPGEPCDATSPSADLRSHNYGSLVGSEQGSTILNSFAWGKLTNRSTFIDDALNITDNVGSNHYGGLVGQMQDSQLVHSYSLASLDTSTNAFDYRGAKHGAFVGYRQSSARLMANNYYYRDTGVNILGAGPDLQELTGIHAKTQEEFIGLTDTQTTWDLGANIGTTSDVQLGLDTMPGEDATSVYCDSNYSGMIEDNAPNNELDDSNKVWSYDARLASLAQLWLWRL